MIAFHPIIQKWFAERYGEPTDIQALAWPRIAQGQHLLITAPTGSGKTLTAFLWALNRFATRSGDTAASDRYLDVLHHLTHRSFRPIRQLRIETINSEAAVSSPYLACIEARFDIIRDYKSVVIQRAFQ